MNTNLKQCITDWKTLLLAINSRPTSVLELVPRDPNYIGFVDSSGTAVGGVWTPGTSAIHPTVWRLQWPEDIQQKLVSANNPKGTISINDLETAGILLAWLVLEKITPTPLKYTHVGIHCDNDSAVNWIQRKSTTTSTIAGHLLRATALRQHTHHSAPLQVIHIKGIDNKMADVASRSFNDQQFINPNKFLQTFSNIFPLQKTYWKEYHMPKKTSSKVISCLRGQPSTMALWTKITKQEKSTGIIGNTIQTPSKSNPILNNAQTQKKSYSSQDLLLGSGQVTTAKVGLSGFRVLQKRWQPSQQPLN